MASYGTAEVDGPRGRFVIRAEEAGTPKAYELVFPLAGLVRLIIQLVRREKSVTGWVVSVRQRQHDPDVAVVHEEVLDSKEAALRRLDELEAEWRRPWQEAQ